MIDIDFDLLRLNIENNSSVELNIEELLNSAKVFDSDFIRVSNRQVAMIFSKDYELLECFGDVVTEEVVGIDECKRS